MPPILKYPRTPHITGSRIQPGDEDLKEVGREVLAGRALVIEEKLDGSEIPGPSVYQRRLGAAH